MYSYHYSHNFYLNPINDRFDSQKVSLYKTVYANEYLIITDIGRSEGRKLNYL